MMPLGILSFVLLVSSWSFSEALTENEPDIEVLILKGGHQQFKKESFVCPAIYGRYPHQNDCSMFYECRYGYPHLMKCNQGKLYDQQKKQCNDKRRVKCIRYEKDNKDHDRDHDHKELEKDDVSKNFRCPYIWGTFAHPVDCSKYFVCVYNVPSLFQCSRSNLYDEKSRKCLDKRRVKCGKRQDKDQLRTTRPYGRTTFSKPFEKTTTEIPTTEKDDHKFRCPFPNGRFVDPLDCSQFYKCRSAVPTVHKCPKSTLYDERKEECLEDKYVSCNERPGGVREEDKEKKDKKKELRCPFLWGIFPHHEDCSKYIICIYNVPTMFNCGKNYLFHAYYRRCFPKDQVTCDYRINPDDLSPQTPKTTPTSTFIPTTTPITTMTIPASTETPPTTTMRPSTTSVPTTTSTTPATTTTTPDTTTTTPDTTTTTPDTTTMTITTTTPATTTTTPDTTTNTPDTTTNTPDTTTDTPDTTTATPDTTTTTPDTTTTLILSTTPTSRPTTSDITSTLMDSTPSPRTTAAPVMETSTPQSTTRVPKPNTPPPTDCEEDDLDCIIDGTGDVSGWFDCPERYGHFPHGSNHQLFIHCDNWHPYVKQCADGTVFSPKYLVCMWLNIPGLK